MKAISLFADLLNNERTAGMLLVICTVISLTLANSAIGEAYLAIWHFPMAGPNFEYWIHAGLMAIFFLMIGLELEREHHIGELSDRKQAMLPLMAAFGGMLVPAGITCSSTMAHHRFRSGYPHGHGHRFRHRHLGLVGRSGSFGPQVFLTALAVIDDLGRSLPCRFLFHWY